MCNQRMETQEYLSDVCPEISLPHWANFAKRDAHRGHLMCMCHGHIAGCGSWAPRWEIRAFLPWAQPRIQAGCDLSGALLKGRVDSELLRQIQAQKKQAIKGGPRARVWKNYSLWRVIICPCHGHLCPHPLPKLLAQLLRHWQTSWSCCCSDPGWPR